MGNGTGGGLVELKDLDPREVSLVDSPAIAEKFVVIKNETGGNEMSDEDKRNKDEETQAKEDEKNKADNKDEETQADNKDEEGQDEKTDDKDKDEETQAASPEVVGALKQIMSLTNKLMEMVSGAGGGAMPEATEKNDGSESVETLMAKASFMLEELSEGRIPGNEAVEKAGKRVTPTRLKKLETLQGELASLITDLKGEAKKEETQSADEDKDKDKTEKSESTSDAKLDTLLAEVTKVSKRLDAVEAGGGAARGQSEDEGDGGKEKTEKSDEGSMSGFFTGIGGN